MHACCYMTWLLPEDSWPASCARCSVTTRAKTQTENYEAPESCLLPSHPWESSAARSRKAQKNEGIKAQKQLKSHFHVKNSVIHPLYSIDLAKLMAFLPWMTLGAEDSEFTGFTLPDVLQVLLINFINRITMNNFLRGKDVSAVQLINETDKREDTRLSISQEGNQTQTYSWAFFLHMKLSQRFLCPLSRLPIEMPFSSSDYSWFHNGHGGHY